MYKFDDKGIRNIFSGLLRFLICFFFLSGFAVAADFSANLVFKVKEGWSYGKICAAGEKVRITIGEVTTILRLDKNIMWILAPESKMYIEMPLQLQNIFVGIKKMPGEIERRFVGKEIVDGKKTDKYMITYNLPDNNTYTAFLWTVIGSDIPVKTATADHSWIMEYKNLYVGKQEEGLFEIPAGYENSSAKK